MQYSDKHFILSKYNYPQKNKNKNGQHNSITITLAEYPHSENPQTTKHIQHSFKPVQRFKQYIQKSLSFKHIIVYQERLVVLQKQRLIFKFNKQQLELHPVVIDHITTAFSHFF